MVNLPLIFLSIIDSGRNFCNGKKNEIVSKVIFDKQREELDKIYKKEMP